MNHSETSLGDDPVPVKPQVAQSCDLSSFQSPPGLRGLSKLQVLSWQERTRYAMVLRMSKCFSPSLAWALKPSLSYIATVPNQRAHDPPSLEVGGYDSTIPPPCFRMESRVAFKATFATPFFLKSLSTKKHVRRQSFWPSSADRSSLL